MPSGFPSAVTGTKVWRAPEQTTTSTSPKAAGAMARASAQAMTTVVHQRNGSCSVQPTLGVRGHQLRTGERHQPPVAPQRHLGDGGPEVDGEDHRRVHEPGHRARPSRPGRDPGRWSGPWPCRRRHPPSRRAPRSSTGSRPPSPSGPPRKSTGTPTLATTRATARPALAPRLHRGDGHLHHGRAHVVRDDGRQHDVVGVAADPSRRATPAAPPAPPDRPRGPVEHLPSSSSADAVSGSARSMRVMCLIPVQPSAAARATLATRRSSSSKTDPASPVRFSER